MVKKLRCQDPYTALRTDPYSSGLFTQTVNGFLEVVQQDDKARTIVLETSFLNSQGSRVHAAYFFVQCLESECHETELTNFRHLLEYIVREKASGNYMQVNPILIAASFDEPVIEFVEQYNSVQKRKPIELFCLET